MKAKFVTAFAAVAVSVLTLAGQPAAAQQTETVTLAYSYEENATYANLVVSAERFAKAEELELKLIAPGNITDPVKLVTSNAVQFAIVNPPVVIAARSRAVPVVSIIAQLQVSALGMMASAASGIHTAKDMAGKTLGITGVPVNHALLVEVLRANNIGIDKVKMIEVGYGGTTMLAAGKVDAVEGISDASPFEPNLALNKPMSDTSTSVFLPFSTNGAPPFTWYNIVVTDDYRAQHADTIRRFAKAWREGMEWAMKNPEETVKLYIKRYPETKYDFAIAEWKATMDLIRSPDTDAHGLGWQNPEVLAKLASFMAENKLVAAPVDPASVFTNEFLPK